MRQHKPTHKDKLPKYKQNYHKPNDLDLSISYCNSTTIITQDHEINCVSPISNITTLQQLLNFKPNHTAEEQLTNAKPYVSIKQQSNMRTKYRKKKSCQNHRNSKRKEK